MQRRLNKNAIEQINMNNTIKNVDLFKSPKVAFQNSNEEIISESNYKMSTTKKDVNSKSRTNRHKSLFS